MRDHENIEGVDEYRGPRRWNCELERFLYDGNDGERDWAFSKH